MRRAAFFLAWFVVFCFASVARPDALTGSVFLFPVDSSFRSVGRADYLSDLNAAASAVLSGEHRVNQDSPRFVYTTPVDGDGAYSYILEGPASPGACYGTSLHVVADPPGLFNDKEATWTGDTKCAPRDPPPLQTCYQIEMGDCAQQSPIVINFEHGTYELTGADSPVSFDIAGSGQAVRLGWTAAGADEAFLCLDRDGNGRIGDGTELFGNATSLADGSRAGNGFIALAQYDDNADGVIDSHDPIWPRLLLWRDANHDGLSQSAEITPVTAGELTTIGLDYRWTGRRDAFGNAFRYEATAWMSGPGRRPTPHPVYDIFFALVP